ncbi:MAG: aspartyl protease family protein [Candidatus Binatia bacterium]
MIIAAAVALSDTRAASEATLQSAPQAVTIEIYASADETALPIGTLAAGENVTPIAETQGAGGIKWYLVKSRSGVIGWIKQGTSEQSKKADHFFRSLPPEPSGIAVQIPTSSAAAAAKNAVVIPVTLSRGAIIVPVTFNGSVTANLLLDTGASMTMISRRLASNLALPAITSGLFSGIGGTINAQIARVESIKVGDAEVGGMPISIHDISRFPRFEGLLGMDFLSRFHVSVDSAKQLLVLTPK